MKGNPVVNYEYDAWGNHTVSGSNTTLGNLNPFRYRGYYFDKETGLYYLKTRYYDSEVGRFISQDSIAYAEPQTVNGLNLYAYCGNNPVMYVDPDVTTKWWECSVHLRIPKLTPIIIGRSAKKPFLFSSVSRGFYGQQPPQILL